MTSKTETGLVALVAALAAAATTDPDKLPQPLRNEALPARLLEVTGPGRIEQSFNFRGYQTNGATMLTAVLKNGTAAAGYA